MTAKAGSPLLAIPDNCANCSRLDDVIRVVDNILVKKKLERLQLSIKEMNELLSILCDITNNTRRWENYGHMPAEMIRML